MATIDQDNQLDVLRPSEVDECIERRRIHQAFLDQQRDVVLWKLDGLTDDQLRDWLVGSTR